MFDYRILQKQEAQMAIEERGGGVVAEKVCIYQAIKGHKRLMDSYMNFVLHQKN